MKSIQLLSLAIAAILILPSCKKKKDPEPEGPKPDPKSATVTIKFTNEVDGQRLELGKMKYTNANGNQYQVDMMKYYVSDMTLIGDSGDVKVNVSDLIDQNDTPNCKVDALKVPNGRYTHIKFGIGVPQSRNHSGAQEGDLDPMYGMIWDWNTGYIFFKHEGRYMMTSTTSDILIYHYATDRAYLTIGMPLSSPLVVEGKDKKIFIKFNLNSLYSSPNKIDFAVDYIRQSSSSADYTWMDNIKGNLADAFTVSKVE